MRTPKQSRLTGRVVSGVRRAAGFTQLGWVQAQCLEKLGFKPYPGTLNVEVSEDSLAALAAVERQEGPALIPPDRSFCEARVFPLSIGAVSGAMILPSEDVRIHDKQVIEVMAPVNLRDELHLEDGAPVTLLIRSTESGVDNPS